MEYLTYEYRFFLPSGRMERFEVTIHSKTLTLHQEHPTSPPSWAKLSSHRCPACTLPEDEADWCPAALVLVPVVHGFECLTSHDPVKLEVISNQRRTYQETTAQRAIGSLAGLLLATSGCPVTAFFRPMARFHLPLANEAETIYRAASMYMLAQYFRKRHQFDQDLALDGLAEIYKDIQAVNMHLAQRLREATETDSSVNAIILLDMYARAFPFVLRDKLEELRHLFCAYLPERT